MPVFTNSVLIRATPEVVFDFAADPQNEREWNADLESLEMITEGVHVETVEFDRPRRLVRRNGGALEVTATFLTEPADGGTRFTSIFDATPHGAFKLVFPLFAKKFDKDAAARLLIVRDTIEKRAADAPADHPAA